MAQPHAARPNPEQDSVGKPAPRQRQHVSFHSQSAFMTAHCRIVKTLAEGIVLDVDIEDLDFRAYVVISEPDINRVADFVPQEQFEQGGDLHVTAVGSSDEARQQVEDMAFNMNPSDAVVFLCGNEDAYEATLEELGWPENDGRQPNGAA